MDEVSDYKKEVWLWNKIWKCRVLPRIKIFFWKLCHDALATKGNIARRIKDVDDCCPNCRSRKESCIHVVRDCGWVGGIWEGLGLEVLVDTGFERVREWVEVAMREASETKWETLLVGCWAIWERRNKMVFEGERWCEATILDRAQAMLWEMRGEEGVTVSGQEVMVRQSGHMRGEEDVGWRRPVGGCVKINVDAGSKEGVGVAWEWYAEMRRA